MEGNSDKYAKNVPESTDGKLVYILIEVARVKEKLEHQSRLVYGTLLIVGTQAFDLFKNFFSSPGQ